MRYREAGGRVAGAYSGVTQAGQGQITNRQGQAVDSVLWRFDEQPTVRDSPRFGSGRDLGVKPGQVPGTRAQARMSGLYWGWHSISPTIHPCKSNLLDEESFGGISGRGWRRNRGARVINTRGPNLREAGVA